MNMNEAWVCRDYVKGDEVKILGLFKTVFDREMCLDFWNWRFIKNPFGQGIIKLLFDKNNLIGHYAVVPVHVKVGDDVVIAGLSMTTMTHPEYRKQGIFSFLAGKVYRQAKVKGFSFIYGFPNENSYHGFIENLGWNDVGNGTLNILYRKRTPEKEVAGIKDVYRIEKFDNSIDLLWNRIKKKYKVIVPRTKEFLNWRFFENPDVKYEKYIIKNKNGVMGYVVLKIFKDMDLRIGHIVDMLAIDDDCTDKLLQISYDYFKRENVKVLSCWMQDCNMYVNKLKEHGFIKESIKNYFGAIYLGENDKNILPFMNFSEWHITMGDSDVF